MNRTAPTASHRLQVRTVVVRLSRKLRATYRIRTGRLFSALLAALVSICSPLAHALPEAGDRERRAGDGQHADGQHHGGEPDHAQGGAGLAALQHRQGRDRALRPAGCGVGGAEPGLGRRIDDRRRAAGQRPGVPGEPGGRAVRAGRGGQRRRPGGHDAGPEQHRLPGRPLPVQRRRLRQRDQRGQPGGPLRGAGGPDGDQQRHDRRAARLGRPPGRLARHGGSGRRRAGEVLGGRGAR